VCEEEQQELVLEHSVVPSLVPLLEPLLVNLMGRIAVLGVSDLDRRVGVEHACPSLSASWLVH